MATLLVVFVETMFFAGFISAHMVYVSNQVGAVWPPADQPLLPFADTLRNSGFLILSGITLLFGWWAFRRSEMGRALGLVAASAILGTLFVSSQGVEWLALIQQGLTLTTSGPYGAFFYLIVGAHALHAIGGLVCLLWLFLRLRSGEAAPAHFVSVQIFWYFVVLLWPVIFLQVYG